MKVLGDMAIGGLAIAMLLSPLILLRRLPQFAGRLTNCKAKLVALLLGSLSLSGFGASIYLSHMDICSTPERLTECSVSQSFMIALFLWLGIVSTTQVPFAISVMSAVAHRKT